MPVDDELFASVIVPVYNDPAGIRVTLSSLVDQTYPRSQHEILVVDNGSTDRTKQVISEFVEEYSHVHFLVENKLQGSYAARNRGISEARGDILAFIDADMWVDESWLKNVVESMETNSAPYMGCDVEIRIKKGRGNLVERFIKNTQWDIEAFIKNDNFTPTACLVIRQDLLDEVGTFDEQLISGGDMEFGHRVSEAGFEQRFEPEITMYHPARSSFRELIARMLRVGRGLFQYHHYHPERFTKTIWLQPGSYLPPHPRRFYQRFRSESDSISTLELIAFYTIAYLIRLSRIAGVAYEFTRLSVLNNRTPNG